MERNWRRLLFVVLPLVGFAMHFHLFSHDLQGIHAWRQCETASNVMRFANEDFGIMDPHVYSLEWEEGLKRMEFPAMQWGMASIIKVTRHPIQVMRMTSWIIGMLAAIGMFFLAKSVCADTSVSLLTAWAFHFSPVIFYYTINPLPDNLALMAGIWGLAFFLAAIRNKKWKWFAFSAAFLMLSALAKLPFILFLALPGTWVALQTIRGKLSWGSFFGSSIPFLVGLIPVAAWYLWVIPTWHGNGVVKGILDSSAEDLPEILAIFTHNLVSTLPELLLNYASVPFFLLGVGLLFRKKMLRHELFLPFLALAAGCIAYFVFEINMIGTAHDYYLFPFLPGLFLLVGLGLRYALNAKMRWVSVATMVLMLALPVTAGLRTYPRWQKTGFTSNLITQKEALQNAVPADAKILAGHDLSPHIYLYHLQKRGWTLDKDNVDAEKVKRCITAGAEYLFSSHRELEENQAMKPFLGELHAEIGVFRIYNLKKP